MTKYSMGTSYGKSMGQLNTTCEPTFASRCVCLCTCGRALIAQDMLIKKSSAKVKAISSEGWRNATASLALFVYFSMLLLLYLFSFSCLDLLTRMLLVLRLLHNKLYIFVVIIASVMSVAIGFVVVVVAADVAVDIAVFIIVGIFALTLVVEFLRAVVVVVAVVLDVITFLASSALFIIFCLFLYLFVVALAFPRDYKPSLMTAIARCFQCGSGEFKGEE